MAHFQWGLSAIICKPSYPQRMLLCTHARTHARKHARTHTHAQRLIILFCVTLILFCLLWKKKIETGGLSEDEKQAARYELLLKEIKLVQTIDKLKADAMKKSTRKTISKELETMSASKLWEMSGECERGGRE